MVPTNHQNRAIGRPRLCFLRLCAVWKDVFFDEFLVRQKVGQKLQSSLTLADKLKKGSSFGRGRRERRCAREEKEEGLSCLSSKIAGEHSVKDSARRSEGGGGFIGYRLCRRPFGKGSCVGILVCCEMFE